jgi:hypothetical protein
VGRLAHGLPPPRGRCSVAADVPATLAQRLQRSRPNDHEQRRLCGRRATKRSDWRGGRAAASASLSSCLQRPGNGYGGCPGWRSGRRRTERSAAQRPASQSVRQAGLVHAQREGNRARDPRARERAAACFSRQRRPVRVASGMEARLGRDAGNAGARRAAQQHGPAQRGDAKAHRDPAPAAHAAPLHLSASAPTLIAASRASTTSNGPS